MMDFMENLDNSATLSDVLGHKRMEERVAYLEFFIDKLYDVLGPAVDDVFEMIEEQWVAENDVGSEED